MRIAISGLVSGAALMIVGLVIGAGIVFATTYVYGGPATRTVTETVTTSTNGVVTNAVTTTVTTTARTAATATVTATLVTTLTVYSSSTVYAAQIQVGGVSCKASTITHQEDCALVLTNSGNADTATAGTCSLTYGGGTYSAYFSTAGNSAGPGEPVSINAGTSVNGHCTSSNAAGSATPGTQVAGSIALSNGASVPFSTTAS